MRLSVLLAILPVVLGAPAVNKRDEPAPLHVPRDVDALIADKYIVKFKDFSALSALEDGLKILSEDPEHVFKASFRGFSGTLDKKQLEALRDHPDVSLVCRKSGGCFGTKANTYNF